MGNLYKNIYRGFPKLGVVSIVRVIVFWGLYWVPPIFGNYHIYIYMQASWGLRGN